MSHDPTTCLRASERLDRQVSDDTLDAMSSQPAREELRAHAAAYLNAHSWDDYMDDLAQRIAFGTPFAMWEVKDDIVRDANELAHR